MVDARTPLLGRHREDDVVAHGRPARRAGHLRADVHALAARLPDARTDGSAAREVVLVCHDRYRFTVALLAAWSRGLSVALPPNAQPSTVTALRRHDAVHTVLHDVDGMAGLDVRTVLDEGVGRGGESTREPSAAGLEIFGARPLDPGFRAVVVYTSGTTGEPLACPKTLGQLLSEAHCLTRTFEVGPGFRVCATVPPHHIYGLLFSVLVPLVSGASFTRETMLHAEPLAALLDRDGATVLVSVPAHLRALRVLPANRLPAMKRVFSSGAPLPAETAQDLAARFAWTCTEVLGSSETGGLAWRDTPDAAWTPLEGVRITTAHDGRMEVDSAFLDPDAARPYVSFDRIEPTPDGRFHHLGRADGVVKIGSTRISVPELEARLLAIPGVHDAAVIAVEVGGARGFECWAVVVGARHTPASLREALLPWLDAVVIPRRFRFVDALPREAHGKLRRAALRALF